MVELCIAFVVANTKSEQKFSCMRKIEAGYRSLLSEMSLLAIMRIVIDGLPCKDYDFTGAVNKFLRQKQRRLETS